MGSGVTWAHLKLKDIQSKEFTVNLCNSDNIKSDAIVQ